MSDKPRSYAGFRDMFPNQIPPQLIERAAAVQDAVLEMTPGFKEDAKEYLGSLQSESADQDCREARDHNHLLAAAFLKKWGLPIAAMSAGKYAELVNRPFSKSTDFSTARFAVTEARPRALPHIFLTVDVRFPVDMLLARIETCLRGAREELKGTELPNFHRFETKVETFERALQILALRERGLTQEQAAAELEISVDLVQKRERQIRDFLEPGGAARLFPPLSASDRWGRRSSYPRDDRGWTEHRPVL